MTSIKLRTLFAVLTGAVLLTGCPDDEPTPSDTEGTATGDDDGGTMTPTTTPPTTMTSPPTTMTMTDDTGTPMTDDTGTPMTDDTGTPMTDDGSSSSEGGSESSSSGGDTSTMNACADEALGNTLPLTVNGTTVGAGDEFIAGCTDGNSDDYIFEFTAPTPATYLFNTDGSAIDTILSVYPDCAGSAIACNDDGAGAVLCNGYPCSQLSVTLQQDETVLIIVDGYNEAGAFTLNVDVAPPAPDDGYGDCTADQMSCELGEICLTGSNVDEAGLGVAVCAYDFCATAADCPDAPATGTAPVGCLDAVGSGDPFCVLDCANGETCPDGMACFDLAGVCVFELPPPAAVDGGSCCVAAVGTPGCDVAPVQDCVCGLNVGDTFCCTDEWDATCVGEAETLCNAICD